MTDHAFAHSLLAALVLTFASTPPAHAQTPAWQGFGNDAEHTGQAPASPQPMARRHWSATVDRAPPLDDDELPIHYASPMITAANTVLVPTRVTAGGAFRVLAYAGATGALLWSMGTDYVPPPHDWIPPLPATLTPRGQVAVATAGGGVLLRDTPDLAAGTRQRRLFYGLAEWRATRGAYNAAVAVSTPLTSDAAGDLFFGFAVSGATPARLAGGLARLGADGHDSWISAAAAAGDPAVIAVALNCAPALSADGRTVYVAVTGGAGGYLVALDAATLAPRGKVRLLDPATGAPASLSGDSTASPTVAPDGDVYFGVVETPYPSHDSRGWLLHFDATLAVRKTPGSFGWDNTVSILPAAALPAYTGPSTYLLVSKYNNYLGIGPYGDGRNRLAVLDPAATRTDAFSAVTVMAEVETVLSPLQPPGTPTGATYEWCINSAAVDPRTATVIANSEAGRVYRWDLRSNTLTESAHLNAPRGEAYTPTVIGPDGTVYAINNSRLYAIGR